MTSKYWDDFERRIEETVLCMKNGTEPPVRRVAVFVTERCNFRCDYCNLSPTNKSMEQDTFLNILDLHGKTAIIHITGGEPSVVPWLYPLLEKYGNLYRFNLNTNCYIMPPARSLKRLKVSLDSCDERYWNNLVGRSAFNTVVSNIKQASKLTTCSITYTLTKENFRQAVDFIKFSNKEFPDLYALFFSSYKGTNPRFVFEENDIHELFNHVIPEMKRLLLPESLSLLEETLDEKCRVISGVRFAENSNDKPCYLAMSERVYNPQGIEYKCSHLYRDSIFSNEIKKHDKCLYGCNRRLVKFNEEVEDQLTCSIAIAKE